MQGLWAAPSVNSRFSLCVCVCTHAHLHARAQWWSFSPPLGAKAKLQRKAVQEFHHDSVVTASSLGFAGLSWQVRSVLSET